MRKVSVIVLCAAAVVIVGAVLVASVEMPPPSQNVEKAIPDERLPR